MIDICKIGAAFLLLIAILHSNQPFSAFALRCISGFHTNDGYEVNPAMGIQRGFLTKECPSDQNKGCVELYCDFSDTDTDGVKTEKLMHIKQCAPTSKQEDCEELKCSKSGFDTKPINCTICGGDLCNDDKK